MYREAVYYKLTEEQKLDLVQETVNRDSLERGISGSPQVVFRDLPAATSGQTANGVIEINRDMAVNNRQRIEYKGQEIAHEIPDANWETFNTCIHENIHCWQDQINDGTIQIEDEELAKEYEANTFTESVVLTDGSYKMGSQYLSGVTSSGYYSYYFQSTERDAYKGAEEKTNAVIQSLVGKYGTEQSMEEYAKSVEMNGYEAMEQQAAETFQNPEFERDLNQTLMNQYYGANVPVDQTTEEAVKSEMAASYQAMQLSVQEAASPDAQVTEEYSDAMDGGGVEGEIGEGAEGEGCDGGLNM